MSPRVAVVATVFLLAFAFRSLTLTGLGGDDHWSLWTAALFLKGDLPFRDFVDFGDPLYWGMSALAQWIVGYRVVGEVILGNLLVACAFAIAFHLMWEASRSIVIASMLTSAALLLVSVTKLYSYPKIFVYPLALWLAWRYIDRPTLRRAVALAAGVAIAWGFRHDHGAYTGLGAAAAILATHWDEGPRRILIACIRFGIALVVLMGPYLALIQVNEGIPQYLSARMAIARRLDTGSRTLVRFNIDQGAPSHWFRIDPPRPARVQIDWKPDVTTATRTALEQKYSLADALHPKKRLYEYFLTNTSRENLMAMLADSRLVERRGITTSYRENGQGTKVLNEAIASDPPPPDAPPGVRARVVIQWAATVSDTEFPALERQYGLLDPTPDRHRWDYALGDLSSGNIRSIVDDPHVSDTGLIDRTIYRPMEESSLVRLQRTVPLLRISIAPRYWHGLNAASVLYYFFLALPVVVLIMLARDWRHGHVRSGMPHTGAKMLAAAVTVGIVNVALVRKLGYISDHAHIAAILGAWIVGQALMSNRGATSIPARLATAVVLIVSVFATITYVSPLNAFAAAGFNDGIRGAWEKAVRSYRVAATSPPIDEYAPRGSGGDRGLLRYLYECTRQDDRLWLLTETYTVPYYTERRVVGHIFWSMGFLATPESERRTIELLQRDNVPLIVSFGGERPLEFLEAYPLLHEYAARHYTRRHAVPEDKRVRGLSIWLLSDNRRQPTGTYETFGLPCFK